MKITIIQSDGTVYINGVSRPIDMTGLDPAIHAVQFDTVKGKGQIEYVDEDRQNDHITDVSQFQFLRDRYDAWTPPVPPPPTQEQLDRAARRAALQTESADQFIDSLRGATPAQIKTFVQNNTADIGEVRVLLAKLSVALAYALAGGSDK